MVDNMLRRSDLLQRFALVPLLSTGLPARRLAQAPHPRRLLEPVTRGRLRTVGAVEFQAPFQLRDLGSQSRILGNQRLYPSSLSVYPSGLRNDDRKQFFSCQR